MELDRVIARNTAPNSENRMHDDRVAREYGFRGGLVPGITVYNYMAVPLGRAFLESGGMKLRLLKPVYEGEELMIARVDDGTVQAVGADGEVRASGVVREGTGSAPSLLDFREVSVPAARPDASVLAAGKALGTIHRTLAEIEPGALLELSNRILMENVRLGPWLHAGSDLQHFAVVEEGEGLSVRGRVNEVFEKHGHRFVVIETLVLGEDLRLIQHVVHTAIYEPRRG